MRICTPVWYPVRLKVVLYLAGNLYMVYMCIVALVYHPKVTNVKLRCRELHRKAPQESRRRQENKKLTACFTYFSNLLFNLDLRTKMKPNASHDATLRLLMWRSNFIN